MRLRLSGLLLGLVLLTAPAAAQPPVGLPTRAANSDEALVTDRRVQHRTYVFDAASGLKLPYALFVPTTYDRTKPTPLLVTLHGLNRTHDWLMGYEGMLDLAQQHGFIVVTPLGYVRDSWYGSRANTPTGPAGEADVMKVYELVKAEFNIDPKRTYLWGHSMGGAGTYHIAARRPEIWAGLAVAAPAPSIDPALGLPPIKHLPILVLQGDQDPLVTTTRRWVAEMQKLGMQHVYIEKKGGEHTPFIANDRQMLQKVFDFFEIVRKE